MLPAAEEERSRCQSRPTCRDQGWRRLWAPAINKRGSLSIKSEESKAVRWRWGGATHTAALPQQAVLKVLEVVQHVAVPRKSVFSEDYVIVLKNLLRPLQRLVKRPQHLATLHTHNGTAATLLSHMPFSGTFFLRLEHWDVFSDAARRPRWQNKCFFFKNFKLVRSVTWYKSKVNFQFRRISTSRRWFHGRLWHRCELTWVPLVKALRGKVALLLYGRQRTG